MRMILVFLIILISSFFLNCTDLGDNRDSLDSTDVIQREIDSLEKRLKSSNDKETTKRLEAQIKQLKETERRQAELREKERERREELLRDAERQGKEWRERKKEEACGKCSNYIEECENFEPKYRQYVLHSCNTLTYISCWSLLEINGRTNNIITESKFIKSCENDFDEDTIYQKCINQLQCHQINIEGDVYAGEGYDCNIRYGHATGKERACRVYSLSKQGNYCRYKLAKEAIKECD